MNFTLQELKELPTTKLRILHKYYMPSIKVNKWPKRDLVTSLYNHLTREIIKEKTREANDDNVSARIRIIRQNNRSE